MSAKLVFIVFRQQTMTIQGVLQSFRPVDEVEGMLLLIRKMPIPTNYL
jgi:hypothetical protein